LVHWEDIIEGCKQQDEQSQEQLYRVCYADMMKLCIRYATDLQNAAAMYNDAMLKIFNTIRQYEGRGNFMGWIRRIVINTCIDHCRRQTNFIQCPVDEMPDNTVSINPDIYDRLSANDVINLLHELPRNTALVFNLFVLEGFKHDEIGQMLGISTGTSKWHLNEARRLLKSKLEILLKKETYYNEI